MPSTISPQQQKQSDEKVVAVQKLLTRFAILCASCIAICLYIPCEGFIATVLPFVGCAIMVWASIQFLGFDAESTEGMYADLSTHVRSLLDAGDTVVRDEAARIMAANGKINVAQMKHLQTLCAQRKKHVGLVAAKINVFEACFREKGSSRKWYG